MIYQWYIFVILLAICFFSEITNQVYFVDLYGKREKRYSWIPAVAIAIPLIYFAGTRADGFGDTSAYRSNFLGLPSSLSGLSGYFTDKSKDKGFTVVSTLIKSMIGNRDVLYLTIIAALCIGCLVYTYRKYSCNFIVSMFLFIASADYIQWTYNGIRQFIPAAILFCCMGLLLKKKYLPLVIIILLLSSIHASAIIMLPMIFIVQGEAFNKKTILFIVAILIAVGFIDQFTDIITNIMENTQYSGEVDQFLSAEGTSIPRVLVYSIPAIFSFFFLRRIRQANNEIVNLCSNMAIATFGLYLLSAFSNGLFLGRLPIYMSLYNYILLPWEIENIFTKQSVKIIYILMIAAYMVYYTYQTKYVWLLI